MTRFTVEVYGAGKYHTWVRFAVDSHRAFIEAKEAVEREFPNDGYVRGVIETEGDAR